MIFPFFYAFFPFFYAILPFFCAFFPFFYAFFPFFYAFFPFFYAFFPFFYARGISLRPRLHRPRAELPLSQIASDLRFAIRITNRNRSQIARFGPRNEKSKEIPQKGNERKIRVSQTYDTFCPPPPPPPRGLLLPNKEVFLRLSCRMSGRRLGKNFHQPCWNKGF